MDFPSSIRLGRAAVLSRLHVTKGFFGGGVRGARSPPLAYVLQQRSRPPPPAFSFRFCDRFQVFDMGARLRQDVVQVVSDADEREPFLEKLSDTRRSEQE